MVQKQKRSSAHERLPIPSGVATRRILTVRGQNVMLDSDLAELYQVPTKSLNLAVRRNEERFPEDFMFQLKKEEFANLRFQSETSNLRFQTGTSNEGRGGRRYMPYVFTQEGVAMLSSVLHSERAVKVNVAIMRAFVQLRRLSDTHRDLSEKIAAMEKKYDGQFSVVFKAIQRLLQPPVRRTRPIGFVNSGNGKRK
jgi:hypothetical protein